MKEGDSLRLRLECKTVTLMPGGIEQAHLIPSLDQTDTDAEKIARTELEGIFNITVDNPNATGAYFVPGDTYIVDLQFEKNWSEVQQNAVRQSTPIGQPAG